MENRKLSEPATKALSIMYKAPATRLSLKALGVTMNTMLSLEKMGEVDCLLAGRGFILHFYPRMARLFEFPLARVSFHEMKTKGGLVSKVRTCTLGESMYSVHCPFCGSQPKAYWSSLICSWCHKPFCVERQSLLFAIRTPFDKGGKEDIRDPRLDDFAVISVLVKKTNYVA